MPASASASSNNLPAGPTKGLPVRSSSFPGCSPTKRIAERRRPSPKTVCVPFFHRSQALQSAAAALSVGRVGCSGIKSAAEDLYEDLRVAIVFGESVITKKYYPQITQITQILS